MMTQLTEWIRANQRSDKDGVHYLSEPGRCADSIASYLDVRGKEGRLLSDEVVAELPRADRSHPLRWEWDIRGESARRLCRYLAKPGKPLALLDIGCGNGWMSHGLAGIPGCEVFALDLNEHELKQGARVFSDAANLTFLYGDLFEDLLPHGSFQVITLAGAIQYFPDLRLLMTRLLQLLEAGGEIHVVDSPFYTQATIGPARERTRAHFTGLGYPKMADHYHHPLLEQLAPFHPHCLYDPKRLLNRVYRKLLNPRRSPFPWYRVRKED